METERAKELLAELSHATTQVTHQVNSPRGLTKKAAKRELDAANAIFKELTGITLTKEEWEKLTF